MNEPDGEVALRWRLALGRYARNELQAVEVVGDDARMDWALDVLYGRAHVQRGYRGRRWGGLDESALSAPRWLDELKALFPRSVFETIQGHAVQRLGLAEVLASPSALKRLEPNVDLMKVVLAFQGSADPAMAEPIRNIVRQVVEEMRRRLQPVITRAVAGARNRFRRSQRRRMADFDIRATVRANLKTYRPDRRAIVAEQLRFTARHRRRLPWTVILCVDQSASMLTSLIHAVVSASILASLPSISVKLVVFDTSVVDLSDRVCDPVDLLLSVQLGGGTDIGGAVAYCETLVTQPSRTVFALVSDFAEGASPTRLVAAVRRLAEAQVTLIGLAALAPDGEALYDRNMATRLAGAGMTIAALTPDRFAEWLADVIQ